MSNPPGDAEKPEPEWPRWADEEPVVDLGEKLDGSLVENDAAPDGESAAETPNDAPAQQKVEGRLEDADPDPESSDNDAAEADRSRGMITLNRLEGDRNRIYEAEHMIFYGTEISAVPRHGPVPATLLKKLRSVYVATPCEGKLLSALRVSPLQCLVGPARTGRTTAAIAIAASYLEQEGRRVEGNVHILTTAHGLAAVDASSIPEGKALIMAVDEVQSSLLTVIEDCLRLRRSILIVVTAAEPVGPTTLKDNWTVYYSPPAPEDVFRRHLELRLPPNRVDELLSLNDVRTNLGQCKYPHEAFVLTARVIASLDDGLPDDKLLSGLESSGLLNRANEELRKNELWKRNFLIATTVLFDLAAGTVTREATRLAELHEPKTAHNEVHRTRWFEGPLTDWSDCVEPFGNLASDGSGRVVRLAHPELAQHLLRVVWHEHLGERDMLLSWLLGLGAHPQKRVRVKAAQTAAQLACYDFDVVIREVIQAWAMDGGFRTRQTSSLALEALTVAAGGRFAGRVRGLVRSWAKTNNIQLLASAVTVYGTFLGAKDPDEALDRMEEITGGRVRRWDGRRDSSLDMVEHELATIVHHALLSVFDAGAQEQVIHALAGWSRLPHWRWQRAAVRTLVDLARKVGSNGWPLLAELANAQSRIYADVLALWRNALDSSHRNENGWDALRRWQERADQLCSDPDSGDLVGLIERLLADMRADSAEMTKSLDFHQQIWAFRKDKATPH